MRTIRLLLVVLLPMLVLASCGGGSGEGPGGSGIPDFSRVDLSNASALAIVPATALSNKGIAGTREDDEGEGPSPAETRLVKITAEGMIVEVTCYDEEDNEIIQTQHFAPTALYDINATYLMVVICAATPGNMMPRNIPYLIRKYDGAVFSLENVGLPAENLYYQNEKVIRTDAAGNIYYIVDNNQGDKGVYRINTQNPDNLTAMRVSASTETAMYFTVDNEGNVMYTRLDGTTRIRFRSGGGYGGYGNIPHIHYWTAPDGNFYSFPTGFDVYGMIYKVEIVDNKVELSTYGTTELRLPSGWPEHSYLCRTEDRVILIAGTVLDQIHLEVYNPSGEPREIEYVPSLNLNNVGMTAMYYYLAGTDVDAVCRLLRVDPTNDLCVDLLDPGAYEIAKMSVASNGVITFSGIRNSDGLRVIGEIDAAGNVRYNTELDAEVMAIVRVL